MASILTLELPIGGAFNIDDMRWAHVDLLAVAWDKPEMKTKERQTDTPTSIFSGEWSTKLQSCIVAFFLLVTNDGHS